MGTAWSERVSSQFNNAQISHFIPACTYAWAGKVKGHELMFIWTSSGFYTSKVHTLFYSLMRRRECKYFDSNMPPRFLMMTSKHKDTVVRKFTCWCHTASSIANGKQLGCCPYTLLKYSGFKQHFVQPRLRERHTSVPYQTRDGFNATFQSNHVHHMN